MTKILDCRGIWNVMQLDYVIDTYALNQPTAFLESFPDGLLVTDALAEKIRQVHNLASWDKIEHRTLPVRTSMDT